jgi:hypothetical protein
VEGEEGESGQLSSKGFGGGDADFRSCMDINAGVGNSGDAGPHDIGDAEDESPALSRLPKGSQRISRLPTLANAQHYIIRPQNNIPIPKLRGIFYIHR